MKIKKYLSILLAVTIIASSFVFTTVNAAEVVLDNFESAAVGALTMTAGAMTSNIYAETGSNTSAEIVENKYGQTGKSLKIKQPKFPKYGSNQANYTDGVFVKFPQDVHTVGKSASFNIYVPELPDGTYLQLFWKKDGSNWGGTTTVTSGWHQIGVYCASGKQRICIDGVTKLEGGMTGNYEARFRIYSFSTDAAVNEAYESDDMWYIIDDFEVQDISLWGTDVEGMTAAGTVIEALDTATVDETIASLNLTNGVTANAVFIDSNGDTTIVTDNTKNATHIVEKSQYTAIRLYKISIVKTVNGIPIPTSDFDEGGFDSMGWTLKNTLGSYTNGQELLKVESGTVTVGPDRSPYSIGGIYHAALTGTESLVVTKDTSDGVDYYRFKSTVGGEALNVRLKEGIDEAKMEMGEKTVVDFTYRPNSKALFNVGYRWRTAAGVKTSGALFGNYTTECITFNRDGKIYIGGYQTYMEPTQAREIGEYTVGEAYEVSAVMNIIDGNKIGVTVYINGKIAAEDVVISAADTSTVLTSLSEIDLYMSAEDPNNPYDIQVADITAYTTDEFASFASDANTTSEIQVGGKTFYLLDAAEDGSKFYLMSKENAGQMKFDSNMDRNHELLVKTDFDPADEHSIAYKLNDEANPESAVNALNVIFGANLIETTWSNDKEAKLGLLSLEEAGKYAEKISTPAANDSYFWWLFDKNPSNTGDVYAVSNANPRVIVNRKANGIHIYARPTFWVNRAFFTATKLDAIGSEAAKTFDKHFTRGELLGTYTADELNTFFVRPTVTAYAPEGRIVVGQTLTAKYDWVSDYNEAATSFKWYSCGTVDGVYAEITGQTGKSLTITPDLAGLYIKAGIIPVNNSNINPRGAEVISPATNKIYNEAMLDTMLTNINNADASTIYGIISSYNDFIGADLSLATAGNEAMTIMASETITEPEDVKKIYMASIALAQLNHTAEADMLTAVANPDLNLDLTHFNKLTAEQKAVVLNQVYNKSFASYTVFVNTFTEKVMLIEFSNADRDAMYQLLIDYGDDAEIKAALDGFSEYKIRQVASRIVGTYTSYSDIKTAITTAAAEVKNLPEEGKDDEETSDPPGGGGGGGGGGIFTGTGGGTDAGAATDTEVQTSSQRYTDVDASFWGMEAIESLSKIGVINGNGDGTFLPDKNVTREEFVKMVVIAFNLPEAENVSFADVKDGAWYQDYISRAVAAGIIQGYDDNRFGVGDVIKREDMAVILYRAAKDILPKLTTWNPVGDAKLASEYATTALGVLFNAKVMVGDGKNVDPKGMSSRAMAAQVLYNTLKYAK